MSDELDDLERMLLGQIDEINREYQRTIKPFVDRLIEIRSLRPLPPFYVVIDTKSGTGITVHGDENARNV